MAVLADKKAKAAGDEKEGQEGEGEGDGEEKPVIEGSVALKLAEMEEKIKSLTEQMEGNSKPELTKEMFDDLKQKLDE